MVDYVYGSKNELLHYGIKGQKWGIRKYQNSDGSLTEEGRKRYGIGSGRGRRLARDLNQLDEDLITNKYREESWKKAKYMRNSGEKAKKYEKARIDTEKAIKNLLAEAKRQGLSVNSKEINRYARKGEMQAAILVGGALGATVTELSAWAITGNNAVYKGKKYKVW